MTVSPAHVANMPTIADFVAANPNADPKELLHVVMAETERLKEDNERIKEERAIREHEYKVATEVELDEHLQARPKTLGQLLRFAKVLVDGGLVPDNYLKVKTKNNGEGNPVASVAGAIMFANRCNVDVFVFLSSSYPLNGKIALEAKLVNSLLIGSGKIVGRPSYEKEYDDAGNVTKCTCKVIDKETGEEKTKEVTWDMVVLNGWHLDRQGQKSKWVTLRDTMFEYRSSTLLSRVHYPDVLYGTHTIDEMEDIERSNGSTPAAGNGSAAVTELAALSERLGAAPKAKPKKDPKTEEPTTVENDPFPPSPVPTKAAQPVETDTKPEVKETATKQSSNGPAVKETAANGETAKPSTGKTAAQLKGFISIEYDRDAGDFDIDKIAEDCAGHANYRELISSIINRKHPKFEDYLADTLRDKTADQKGQSDDESQEPLSTSGDENQDIPDFIREPVKRPKKIGLMAEEYEIGIFDRMEADQLRKYLVTEVGGKNPHLDQVEQAYLLSLGNRKLYQLENKLPLTDKKKSK